MSSTKELSEELRKAEILDPRIQDSILHVSSYSRYMLQWTMYPLSEEVLDLGRGMRKRGDTLNIDGVA